MMSATSASSDDFQSWSGPGIMQSYIELRDDSKLSQETLESWFHGVYLPAVMKTGIVKAITSWKAVSPKNERRWMIIFDVENLELVRYGNREHVGGGLPEIPRTSEMFPMDGPVDDFIDFESRILEKVESYGDDCNPADDVTTMIYAAMQPAPGEEEDLDAWYREEHNEQMSKEPGYKQTTRYSPLFQTRNIGKPSGLDFVAIHQFGEGHRVGTEVVPLKPMTDWTKRAMSNCTSIDAAVYRKEKTFTL